MKDQYVTRELGQTIIKGLPPSKRVSLTQALQVGVLSSNLSVNYFADFSNNSPALKNIYIRI